MKWSVRPLVSSVFLLLLAALAAHYIASNIDDFRAITISHPWYVPLLILLTVIIYFVLGLMQRLLLLPLDVRLRPVESFQLAVAGGFYNLITPFKGGVMMRAIYLKKEHSLPYTDSMVTVAAGYLVTFFVASVLGLAAILYVQASTDVMNVFFLVLFGAIAVASLVVTAIPQIPEPKHRWFAKGVRLLNSWHTIKRNKPLVLQLVLLTLAQFVAAVALLYYQFGVFGIQVSLSACVVLTAVSLLSLILAVTPAGIGVTEAITVFSALTLGISPADSLSATILGRLVSVLVLFVLGPLFSYKLLRTKFWQTSTQPRVKL